ncbi:MAG: response regulator transcription factor [Bacteroidetes bacterium]|nr:response regulator transcription factor [Bacteroidota bacterium]
MNPLKCFIIDDEPLARKGIEEYVNEIDFLTLSGKAENPVKAFSFLCEHKVDLIFLDIQMPKMSGIDFIRNMKNPPMVIITTAFPEYAIESYELDILDYLLKPVPLDRFIKACNKAYDYYLLKKLLPENSGLSKPNAQDNHFYIKNGNKFDKICFDQVLYIEAMENYVLIETKEKKYITYLTFKGIEASLPPDLFVKVHKSYLVALHAIESINGNEINVSNKQIPISRNFREQALNKILGKKLIKR